MLQQKRDTDTSRLDNKGDESLLDDMLGITYGDGGVVKSIEIKYDVMNHIIDAAANMLIDTYPLTSVLYNIYQVSTNQGKPLTTQHPLPPLSSPPSLPPRSSLPPSPCPPRSSLPSLPSSLPSSQPPPLPALLAAGPLSLPSSPCHLIHQLHPVTRPTSFSC